MLSKFFQPVGRVHQKFNQYMFWSFTSNIISSTQYVLSTHSMLCTIGHDNNEFNMSYNYIVKDIIGQVGGLYYINKTCTKYDKDINKYTKETLIIQQLSLYLECITPFVPNNTFLLIAGFANIGKNVTATGLGATNAKIIQTLAIDNNIGEIYAKINVLNTLGSSIGMIIGLGITHYIPDHGTRLCMLPLLSTLRYWTFVHSIRNIC